jgi:hypothetical protein
MRRALVLVTLTVGGGFAGEGVEPAGGVGGKLESPRHRSGSDGVEVGPQLGGVSAGAHGGPVGAV